MICVVRGSNSKSYRTENILIAVGYAEAAAAGSSTGTAELVIYDDSETTVLDRFLHAGGMWFHHLPDKEASNKFNNWYGELK